ncbi:MAG: chorismate synthase [Thermoproteota archaeon]
MLGKLFQVSFFGESHGKCVGVIIEGCPPGIKVSIEEINSELEKRKPGSSIYVSPRKEEDKVEILSGIFNNFTTGFPVSLVVYNKDVVSSFYEKIRNTPRPSHADYVATIKYFGYNDYRGGGIFSGRLTLPMVIAGYFAKKILNKYGIEIYSYLKSVGPYECNPSIEDVKENTYKSPLRFPDLSKIEEIEKYLIDIIKEGDTVGGIIETIALNLPVGLGEPPIDTLDGDLAKALFAIPAVKGVEFGSGFKLAKMKGSEANDPYAIKDGKIITLKNNSGGILGGISNGMPLIHRVVLKPASSIRKKQKTVDLEKMEETEIVVEGRHDPCIAIRAVPVVESVTAIVLADHLLRWLSWKKLLEK